MDAELDIAWMDRPAAAPGWAGWVAVGRKSSEEGGHCLHDRLNGPLLSPPLTAVERHSQ